MRILVTGGAGFIGSHLCERLLESGHTVVALDNLITGSTDNIAHLSGRGDFSFIRHDVTEYIYLQGTVDFIFHLASPASPVDYLAYPIQTLKVGALGTHKALGLAREKGAGILLASTSEVYGKSPKTVFSEEDDVVYGPTTYSRWSYACSKAIDEYLGLAYARQRGLSVVVARFFNTVGPRQVGRYGMVIPRFVESALAGRVIEVHGDGRQSRCFCDVRDVVQVLPKLLGDPACHGRVFNVGHDEPIEIMELAHLVRSTLGSASEIRLVPYAEALGEGFDDLRHRRPDLTRLRQAVGFRPTIALEQTIRDLAQEMGRAPDPTRKAVAP